MRHALAEYTRQVTTNLDIKAGIDPLMHCALGLAGEAGEVADLVKKSQYIGRELDREKMLEELGDLFWYFIHILWLMRWTLVDIMKSNILKLVNRRPRFHYSPTALHDAIAADD